MGGEFFLAENLVDQTRYFIKSKGPCKAAQRFIETDLVLLDLISVENESGIEKRGAIDVSDHLVALLDDDPNGFVFFSRRAPIEASENLLKVINMSFGFHEMQIQGLFQFLHGRGFHHFRQLLQEKVFAVPRIFQSALEEIRQVIE